MPDAPMIGEHSGPGGELIGAEQLAWVRCPVRLGPHRCEADPARCVNDHGARWGYEATQRQLLGLRQRQDWPQHADVVEPLLAAVSLMVSHAPLPASSRPAPRTSRSPALSEGDATLF